MPRPIRPPRVLWLEVEIRRERRWIANLIATEAMPSLIDEHRSRLSALESMLHGDASNPPAAL